MCFCSGDEDWAVVFSTSLLTSIYMYMYMYTFLMRDEDVPALSCGRNYPQCVKTDE